MIVYLISHRLTGKAYVGKTKRTLEQRWREHLQASRSGSDLLLSRALRKHGPEAFLVTVLEGCADEVELDERERWWIAKLGTHGERGYNLTDGGDGVKGLVHTPETRARMSEARRGEKNVNWGGLTDEHRQCISRAKIGTGTGPRPHARGWHHGDEARKKIGAAQYVAIVQLDMQGNQLASFSSMLDAERVTGVGRTGISRCCRFPHRSAAGYRFRYAADQKGSQ